MSEKRFTYDKPLVAFSKGGINDNVTGETYEFTMDTVLDLLNKLYEENEQLRTQLMTALSYVPIETRVNMLGSLKRTDWNE